MKDTDHLTARQERTIRSSQITTHRAVRSDGSPLRARRTKARSLPPTTKKLGRVHNISSYFSLANENNKLEIGIKAENDPGLDRKIHDGYKNKKLNEHLISALKTRPDTAKQIAKLESCRCGVQLDNGLPKVIRLSCGHRNCSYCWSARAVEKKVLLTRVFQRAKALVDTNKWIQPHFLTLTLRPNIKGTDNRLRFLRKKLTWFLNHKWSRRHIKASYYRTEVTWRDEAEQRA